MPLQQMKALALDPPHRLDQTERLMRLGQEPRLQQTLGVFGGRLGIPNDPAADTHLGRAVAQRNRADPDIERHRPARDIADRAAIDAARLLFDLANNLHRADFRRPRHRSAGKQRPHDRSKRSVRAQAPRSMPDVSV